MEVSWNTKDFTKWIANGCRVNDKVLEIKLDKSFTGEIPVQIENITELLDFCVENANIKTIPKTIGNLKYLTNLKFIDIPNLSDIPKSIKYNLPSKSTIILCK